MFFAWFKSTFLKLLKFIQIKEGRASSWGEPILQNSWIIWAPFLYFNFKSFKDPNSLSFIRCQCLLSNWVVLLSEIWNFYKEGGANFLEGTYSENGWIIWSPLLYVNLKSAKDQILCNSLDFNAFYLIQEYLSHIFEIFQY